MSGLELSVLLSELLNQKGFHASVPGLHVFDRGALSSTRNRSRSLSIFIFKGRKPPNY